MNLSPDGQTHDRQTTQYIDNHVTAVHVRVLDRQIDGQTDVRARQTDRQIENYIPAAYEPSMESAVTGGDIGLNRGPRGGGGDGDAISVGDLGV